MAKKSKIDPFEPIISMTKSGRPKKPTKPRKPSEPIKPSETISEQKHVFMDSETFSVEELMKKVPDYISEKEVFISYDYDYSGYCDHDSKHLNLYYEAQKPNPWYDNQLRAYNKKIEKHKLKLAHWKGDMKRYKVQLDAYQQWEKQAEIEEIEKQIETLSEQLEKEKASELKKLQKRLGVLKDIPL